MVTYALEELPPALQQMVRSIASGESAVITENSRPIAQLSAVVAEGPAVAPANQPRQFGFAQGLVLYMAPDFDEPVDDFGDL